MTSALLSTKLSVALDRGDHGNGIKLVSEENRVRGDVISPENDAGFGLSSQRGTSRLPKSTLIICGLGPARDEALPVAADKSSENSWGMIEVWRSNHLRMSCYHYSF